MSEPVVIRGVIVTHGVMAQGLVDAVRRIAGNAADALAALSNDGLGPQELRERLDETVGEEPTIVFVDLLSGSCSMAAMLTVRGATNRAVVCGVNLPILLDFVFHQEMEMEALIERLVEKGRTGIRRLPERG